MASIGAAVFAAVVLILVLGGTFFIITINSQQAAVTDTYGTTANAVTNTSQNLVGNMTGAQGEKFAMPLILIVAVIVVIMIVFALYLAAKVFFH